MAWFDITSDCVNNAGCNVGGVGDFLYEDTNNGHAYGAYGFSLSGYDSTVWLASDNIGKHNTSSVAKLTFTDTSGPVYVRITYISYGENNWDYGTFMNSGVTISSGTSYSSASTGVFACAKGKASTIEQTITYYLPSSTFIMFMYHKDGSTHSNWDRLLVRIEVDSAGGGSGGSDLTYYYYGLAVKFYGYTTAYSANTYLIDTNFTTPYFNDGSSTTYQSAITNGYVVYWTSGSTDDDPMYLEPGYWDTPSFRANGHSWVSTDVTYFKIELATSPSSCIISPTTIITTHHQAVYLRQYLYGLAIRNVGLMYSHVNLSVYDVNTSHLLTGKTGNNGIATIFSSAFTMNGILRNGSISGQRKSKTGSTIYHSFPSKTLSGPSTYSHSGHPKVDYWYILDLDPPTNSGMVVTGKALKDVAPEANIPATGEALQRALKKSDREAAAWGSFQVDDDIYPPHDYEAFCWAVIQKIGTTAYFTREDENIGPIWSGNTFNIPSGYYINATGGSYTLNKLITVSSNSTGQELLFSGSTYKIADIGTFPTNKTVTINLTSFNRNDGLSINVCAFSPGCNRITQFDAVSYDGTVIYVSSGTSTTPIQSLAYEDIDGDLSAYFTDPCDIFNGYISLNSISHAFTFNAKANNNYYLYLRPAVSVARALTIAGDITCKATFSISQGASKILVSL